MSGKNNLRVFLCHTVLDKPKVRDLHQKLSAEQWIAPWLDEINILPGQDWNQEIEDALDTSDVVVVCLSNNTIHKEGYVQKEIRLALEVANKKPDGVIFIIPLRLEECDVPRKLSQWQWVDYFQNRGYKLLLQSLEQRAKSLGIMTGNQFQIEKIPTDDIQLLSLILDNRTIAEISEKLGIPETLANYRVGRIKNQLITAEHKDKSAGMIDVALPSNTSPAYTLASEYLGLPQLSPITDADHFRWATKFLAKTPELQNAGSGSISSTILNMVQATLECSLVCELKFTSGYESPSIGFSSTYIPRSDVSEERYIEGAVSFATQVIKQHIRNASAGGIYQLNLPFDSEGYCAVFPVGDTENTYMIAAGIPALFLPNQSIFQNVLKSLYASTGNFSYLPQLYKLKGAIFDDLRKAYRDVPFEYYFERYHLFQEQLSKIKWGFEPVVYISNDVVEIASWEAIAMEGESGRIPYDLYSAAELWGVKFTAELDLFSVRTAVTSFIEEQSKQSSRRERVEFSLNIYPDSLERTVFSKLVDDLVVREKLISSGKLTFEISEKQLRNEPSFWNLLKDYTRRFGVGFAVDEFGINNLFASSLAGNAEPTYLKLDSGLLRTIDPALTIEYLKKVVDKHFRPVRFIVTGYDNYSRIDLHSLYRSGVRYIQSSTSGKDRSFKPLTQAEKNLLLSQINLETS